MDGFVWTADGRIHYLKAGSGPPLILLHSVGCSAYEYVDVLDALGRHRTVYAWDMPGHGDSDPVGRHYTIEDFARAVVNFMDALAIERAAVAGSSIGGTICAALGAHHAARVEALVFVESPLRTPAEWAANWATVEGNFGIPTQTHDQVAARVRAVTPEFLTRWNIDRNKAGAKAMVSAMWAIRGFDMAGALARVQTPSAIVYGDNGPTVNKAREFQELLQGAPLTTLAECGHFPMNDDPEAFTRAVLDAVAERAAV
jgi:3-oxoadipate enol-lactonase